MKILSISGGSGGANAVARELHRSWLAKGHESLLVLNLGKPSPGETSLPYLASPNTERLRRLEQRLAWSSRTGRYLSKLLRPVGGIQRLLGFDDTDFPETKVAAEVSRFYDVVVLHRVDGSFFDFRQVPHFAKASPTVAVLHDPWWITGICGQPRNCRNFETGCGHCPLFPGWKSIRDRSGYMLARKRRAIEREPVHAVLPSQWLDRLVAQSTFKHSFASRTHIPNGADLSRFVCRELDQRQLRRALSLPEEALLFLTMSLDATRNPDKGWPFLQSVWQPYFLQNPNARLLVVGSKEQIHSPGVLSIPFVADWELKRQYLWSADIYLHFSQVENCSMAVIEAMACGLPVICSDSAGLVEMVTPDVGIRVPYGDTTAGLAALQELSMNASRRAALAKSAHLRARLEYNLDKVSQSYLDLFQSLSRPEIALQSGRDLSN